MKTKVVIRSLIWTIILTVARLPAHAQTLVQTLSRTDVYQVVQTNRGMWLATEGGAFQLEEANEIGPLRKSGVPVRVISEVEDEIWLGSEYGILRVDPVTGESRLLTVIGEKPITAIYARDDRVWVGTRCDADQDADRVSTCGLYRGRGRTLDPETIISGETIHTITAIGGSIWVGTDRDVYRFEGDQVSRGSLAMNNYGSLAIRQIEPSGSSIWLVTSKPGRSAEKPGPCIELLRNGRIGNVVPDRYRTLYVADVKGEPWFATMNGVFSYTGQNIRRIENFPSDEAFTVIEQLRDSELLGSTKRLWISDNNEGVVSIPNRLLTMEASFNGIAESETGLVLWGNNGIYELRDDIEVGIQPSINSILGQNFSFGPNISVSVGYQRKPGSGYRSLPKDRNGLFHVAISENSMADAEEMARAGDTMAANGSFRSVLLQNGGHLYVVAHDSVGNISTLTRESIFIVPPYVERGLVIEFLVLLPLSLFVILIAPYSRPAMHFVMYPHLRNFLSGGWLFLFLILQRPQRHLMRRFKRNQSLSLDQGVVSFKVGLIAEVLARNPSYIVGDARTLTDFLRALSREVLANRVSTPAFSLRWPVYLDLRKCGDSIDDIESGALDVLENFGLLTDRSVSRLVITNGGFIFLFDGFRGEELGDGSQSLAVYAFMRRHSSCNQFVFATGRSAGYSPRKSEILID